jgi:hypothetical protein
MVTAKERYYYTYRRTEDPNKWSCNKWDVFDDERPVATYVVEPFWAGWRGECSCPAYITCKHIKQLQAALQGGNEDKLPFMKWDPKNGWQKLEGI